MFVPSGPTKPISVIVLPSAHCGSPGPPCRSHAPRRSPEVPLKPALFRSHFSAFSLLTVPSPPMASFQCTPFWTTPLEASPHITSHPHRSVGPEPSAPQGGQDRPPPASWTRFLSPATFTGPLLSSLASGLARAHPSWSKFVETDSSFTLI